MAKKSSPLPSPETRAEILRIIRASDTPLMAKPLSQLLAAPFEITEKQIVPILEEYIAAGELYAVAPSKPGGKPRYWHQDLNAMGRQAVLQTLGESTAPLAAKDLAARIESATKFTEGDLLPILSGLVASGDLFEYPAATKSGPPRYWNQNLDLIAAGRKAVIEILTQASVPLTANELATQITAPVKFTEGELTPILSDLAGSGEIYSYPAATKAGKPRYWNQNPGEVGRKAVLEAMQQSNGPLFVKELAGKIIGPVKLTEADLTPILAELVDSKKLFAYPASTPTGKPRYWNQDLAELGRKAVLESFEESSGPLFAKELAARIAGPVKFTEADLTPILAELAESKQLFAYPAKTATGKPRYWHQNLIALWEHAVLELLRKSEGPVTAKELAGQITEPVKATEGDLSAILETHAAAGHVQEFPASTPKSPRRYWDRDLTEMGKLAILKAFNTVGAQTEANLKKIAKGLSTEQFDRVFKELLDSKNLLRHPPLPGTKSLLFSIRPPELEPYLRDVGAQLAKVVESLLAADVPAGDLRQALVQLIESTGITFGAGPNPGGKTAPAQFDLIGLMKQLEPGAELGALVGTRELRRAVQLEKSSFDAAVLELARQGKLSLHRHDYASSLPDEEREDLVTDGAGTYYVGMAIRRNEG